MTVYVDNMRSWARVDRGSGRVVTSRWSHLLADDPTELAGFAARLGLRSEWIQFPGMAREHYDVVEAVRRRAVTAGAIPISYPRGTGNLIATKRLQGSALDAASRGWQVFPLRSGTKIPAVRDWEHQATGDPDRIRQQWTVQLQRGRWQVLEPRNVGIACGPSGLVVLDLDLEKPGRDRTGWEREWLERDVTSGAEVLAALADLAFGAVPETYTVATGSGGRHLYFTAPSRVGVRNSAGQLGPMIDVRGDGGYVVAAGSQLRGRPGRDDFSPDPGPLRYRLVENRPPAELPDWLTVAITAGRQRTDCSTGARSPIEDSRQQVSDSRSEGYGTAALRGEVDRVRSAPVGHRNHTLNAAAYSLGQLVAAGALDQHRAVAALTSAAESAGLEHAEIAGTIDSGLTAGARRPRVLAASTIRETADEPAAVVGGQWDDSHAGDGTVEETRPVPVDRPDEDVQISGAAPQPGPDGRQEAGRESYGEQLHAAVAILTQARRSRPNADWAEFVSHALAGAAANVGGIEAALAGRPGSWEASSVRQLLVSAVGEDEAGLWSHRTEPVRITLYVDELLSEYTTARDEYEEAHEELLRYPVSAEPVEPEVDYTPYAWRYVVEHGVSTPTDPAAPAWSLEAWRAEAVAQGVPADEIDALERELPPGSGLEPSSVYLDKSPEAGVELRRLEMDLEDRRRDVNPYQDRGDWERLEQQRRREWTAYGHALTARVQAAAKALGIVVPVEVAVDVDSFRSQGEAAEADVLEARLVDEAMLGIPTPVDLPGTPLDRFSTQNLTQPEQASHDPAGFEPTEDVQQPSTSDTDQEAAERDGEQVEAEWTGYQPAQDSRPPDHYGTTETSRETVEGIGDAQHHAHRPEAAHRADAPTGSADPAPAAGQDQPSHELHPADPAAASSTGGAELTKPHSELTSAIAHAETAVADAEVRAAGRYQLGGDTSEPAAQPIRPAYWAEPEPRL